MQRLSEIMAQAKQWEKDDPRHDPSLRTFYSGDIVYLLDWIMAHREQFTLKGYPGITQEGSMLLVALRGLLNTLDVK